MSSSYPNGIKVDQSELFINGVALTPSVAELNALKGVGTTKLQVLKSSGTAANGAIVFTAGANITGFLAQGFNSSNAPVAIGTAVVSDKTLTITPSSGGTANDTWYALVWA